MITLRAIVTLAASAVACAGSTSAAPRDVDASGDDRPDVAVEAARVDASSRPDVVDVPAADDAVDASAVDGAVDASAVARCLPARSDDLLAFVGGLDFARRAGPARMVTRPVGSEAWSAARDAAAAWSAGDCEGFLRAAARMGYAAADLTDRATGRRHWVLYEATGATYNGVFVLRAPDERSHARPLVIDSPHYGYDFTDDRAVRAYRDLDAVALLQNTAHRCNLDATSGCSSISNYACGGDAPRVSDVVHSVDQLYYAVYDGLERARDDLHFEYHGAGAETALPGCARGTANLSQAAGASLPSRDAESYPDRVWARMEAAIGPTCACYHQRESGCALNGAGSTAGRRTNAEAAPDAGVAANVCTAGATALAGRFVHMEAYGLDPAVVVQVLGEVIPHPG